ncbi:putative gypsy type transposase [Tanacetum coccineum]
MSSSSSSKMIELMSSDGETFQVEETVVLQCETIKHMIDDDCANAAIPLPNVIGMILAKVIEYIKKHSEKPKDDDNKKVAEEDLKKFDAEFMKVDDERTLFDLIRAAHYLSIKGLLDLISQATADSIKDLSVEDVRKKFGIQNDFTPEEEADYKREFGLLNGLDQGVSYDIDPVLIQVMKSMGSITSIKYVLTQEHLDAACSKYFVLEEIHPQLPGPDDTMHERPAGKVGMYTRFFDYANYRIPFSNFFVSVLTHFRIPFSQLSVFGSAKNGHFFWVDEFVVPASARFSWFSGTNIVKDRAPTVSEYNVEHANTLIAQASPFFRFPEEFLCWVGISRNYLFDKDTYPRFEYEDGEEMDLNAFIRTTDPLPRSSGNLSDSVEREFGEDVSGSGGEGQENASVGSHGNVEPIVPVADDVVVETGSSGVKRSKKKRVIRESEDTPAASHPPKKLRADYGKTSGSATGGKSPSVINRLLRDSQLTEGGDHTDSATGLALRTISPSERFVVLSDSSHHSSAKSADAEVHELEVSSAGLREKLETYEGSMKQLEEFQDKLMEPLKARLAEIDADFIRFCMHFHETFHPHLFNTIAGRRWFLTHGMRLLMAKCLNSTEYMEALGNAFGRAIKKGMQEGLAAGIEHGQAGRCLNDLEAYNPSAKADFNSVVQNLRGLDFPFLQELSAKKVASIWDVINLLCLDDAVAEVLGMTKLQPDVSQLMVPVCRKQDQAVIGSQALSVALDVCHGRVQKMERNLIERLPFLKDVFVSIDHPLSAEALTILSETPTEPPVTALTTTALSTIVVRPSFDPSLLVEDYENPDLVGAVPEDIIPEPGSEGKVGGSTRGDANVGDFVFSEL